MKPTPLQREGLNLLDKLGYVYLNWEVGCGKTFCSIYALKEYWVKNKKCCWSLFLCPPGAFASVKKAVNAVGLDDKYFQILDTQKKRTGFLYSDKHKPLIVMSYDKFKDPVFFKCLRGKISGKLSKIPWEFVILDEAHTFKNSKAKVTKTVAGLNEMPSIKRKIMGSGTPHSKDYRDLFSQILVLDKGQRFGRSQPLFEQTYFFDRNYKRKGTEGYKPWILVRDDKKDEMFFKIKDCFHPLTLKELNREINQGEKKVEITQRYQRTKYVERTAEQKRLQARLLDKANLEISFAREKLDQGDPKKRGERLIQYYAQVWSQMSVLRQLACGFVYEKTEDISRRRVMRVETEKLGVLRRAVRNIPYMEKILIWTVYNETYGMIEEVLKGLNAKYVKIVGGVSPKKRQELVNEFKHNPDCRVFLSHPKSGGVGLNLQEAKWSIYYSKDYSLIDKIQSEGRNLRMDSWQYNKNVYEIDILTKGTIETEINQNIRKKKDLVKEFEGYLMKHSAPIS